MRSLLFVVLASATLAAVARADTRLVVFEAQECAACAAFRSDILPGYWGAASARPVPMTLVDVDALGTGGFAPAHRIEALPAVVLFEDGRERARIAGRIEREALDRLIERLQELSDE